MKYYGKFCIVCGRRIPELSRRTRTCSEFCRSRYKCGYAPYKDYKQMPYEDLTAIQEVADRLGMTYGKYMAMKMEKKERKDMPTSMGCPFFKNEAKLKLSCEGGTIKFPDKEARSEFVLAFCSNSYNWRKCSIAHCLENYYFRKDEN